MNGIHPGKVFLQQFLLKVSELFLFRDKKHFWFTLWSEWSFFFFSISTDDQILLWEVNLVSCMQLFRLACHCKFILTSSSCIKMFVAFFPVFVAGTQIVFSTNFGPLVNHGGNFKIYANKTCGRANISWIDLLLLKSKFEFKFVVPRIIGALSGLRQFLACFF